MANFHCLLILSLVLLVISIAGATQFKVGGSKGWSVPNDAKEYNQWAEKNRFQIGDSLLFVYSPDIDSVLLVNESAYQNCDPSSPIDTFNDGNSVFVFTRSGPYYFISGNENNCVKNESLVVVVMAQRNSSSSSSPSPSTAPPPSPSIEFIPTSSPDGKGPAIEFIPTSSPDGKGPNSSNGVSMVVGLMGSLGVFMGSLLFVL